MPRAPRRARSRHGRMPPCRDQPAAPAGSVGILLIFVPGFLLGIAPLVVSVWLQRYRGPFRPPFSTCGPCCCSCLPWPSAGSAAFACSGGGAELLVAQRHRRPTDLRILARGHPAARGARLACRSARHGAGEAPRGLRCGRRRHPAVRARRGGRARRLAKSHGSARLRSEPRSPAGSSWPRSPTARVLVARLSGRSPRWSGASTDARTCRTRTTSANSIAGAIRPELCASRISRTCMWWASASASASRAGAPGRKATSGSSASWPGSTPSTGQPHRSRPRHRRHDGCRPLHRMGRIPDALRPYPWLCRADPDAAGQPRRQYRRPGQSGSAGSAGKSQQAVEKVSHAVCDLRAAGRAGACDGSDQGSAGLNASPSAGAASDLDGALCESRPASTSTPSRRTCGRACFR